ncbi:type II secretion system protein [Halalkalibacillus halophilus]|uniref:type II secretion system protein n=1 Tax=Halalkalibacillus halophilus TaxID=392827 RepID=UPI0004209B24|nr:type II secretion system protein [Halalkalibacillus halophilus]
MKYLRINNQKGITLVEVLATLVIISLITTLAFHVLANALQYSEQTDSHVKLRQEANLIITQMRQKHQAETEDYSISFNQFTHEDRYDVISLSLNTNQVSSSENVTIDGSESLGVGFTLENSFGNEYSINTTIEPRKEVETESSLSVSLPEFGQDFYSYLRDENVFVYGSNLSVGGSVPVSSESKNGQVVINNRNQSDISFDGSSSVSVHTIYIDKSGNSVNLSGSASLGEQGKTELISIKGKTNIYGGANLNSEDLFLDGDVDFRSGTIHADTVLINGNLNMSGGGATINANQLYINGSLTLPQGTINAEDTYVDGDLTIGWGGNNNIEDLYLNGELNNETNREVSIEGDFSSSTFPSLPNHPDQSMPGLRAAEWYEENGYENNSTLQSDNLVYSEGNVNIHAQNNNPENFVIVSGGDVTINSNWSQFDGVIFAPNGRVTFTGESFTGVVIARDGFDVSNGGSSISFKNIDQYFDSNSELPFDVN